MVSISDEGPVKVGIATNVRARLSSIQTGSPIQLTLSYHSIVTIDARRLERAVHEELAHRRLSGEWFDVSVKAAVESIIAQSMKPLPSSKKKEKPIKVYLVEEKNRYTLDRESVGLTIEEFSKLSRIRPEDLLKMERGRNLPDPFPYLFLVGLNKAKRRQERSTTNG